MVNPLSEIATAVDAAIAKQPLTRPINVERDDRSVPGKPRRGLPRAQPAIHWRFFVDAPTRPGPDGRELPIIDFQRDVSATAMQSVDGSVTLTVRCRTKACDASKPGFRERLTELAQALRAAVFTVSGETLCTEVVLVDVRAIAPGSQAIGETEVLAALEQALALSCTPEAEELVALGYAPRNAW